MVSKTREKLIEVARQLFVYKGVENTTMNDIATASDKGRRTIYTYFKNKREIFDAVIERQSNAVIKHLESIVDDPEKSPENKLREYLIIRFDIVAVSSPKPYRPRLMFSRDNKRTEKIYRMAVTKERELFDRLLRNGIESGAYAPDKVSEVKAIIAMAMFASDYCYSHQNFDSLNYDPEWLRTNLINGIISIILKK